MLADNLIRQKDPGSSEEFYQIIENLDQYVDLVLKSLNIKPSKLTRLGGEACANIKVEEMGTSFVLKISPYDGILKVADYFYFRLNETNIPHPKIINYDKEKIIIPFEFMIMEFIEGVSLTELPYKFHYQAGKIIGESLFNINKIIINNFEGIANYTIWTNDQWIPKF